MQIFIAVCLAIITLELGALICVGIYTFLKVHQAAAAVEVVAYRVDHQVMSVGETLRNGWVSAGLKAAMSAASHFWGQRR